MEPDSVNEQENVPSSRSSNKKLYLALAVCILTLACAYVFGRHSTSTDTSTTAPKQQVVTKEPAVKSPQYISVEGRYLFNGTIVMARAVEKYAYGDYSQPFSQLDTLEPEKYDAWATDFECPITNNVVPYEKQVTSLVFNCRPEWLPQLTKYVQLFNLANNHTGDQGFPEGLNETRQHLKEAGVQYFGSYDPTVLEDICEVIALPIRRISADGTKDKMLLPVAFCSWHYFNFNRGPTQAELDVVKQYAAVMPVFGFVEMGNEYQANASPAQRVIAKSIVDAGADFVFANNPHWVQDSEVCNGKLIVYSLGNFIFDQIDTETQRGISMDTTVTISYNDNVSAWLELGKKCAAFKDTCLKDAVTAGLKKVNIKLFYTPIANQNGARIVTHKATDSVQKALEERLNWATVSKQLGQ